MIWKTTFGSFFPIVMYHLLIFVGLLGMLKWTFHLVSGKSLITKFSMQVRFFFQWQDSEQCLGSHENILQVFQNLMANLIITIVLSQTNIATENGLFEHVFLYFLLNMGIFHDIPLLCSCTVSRVGVVFWVSPRKKIPSLPRHSTNLWSRWGWVDGSWHHLKETVETWFPPGDTISKGR